MWRNAWHSISVILYNAPPAAKMTVVAIDGETLVCSWNELGKEQRTEVQANEVALYHEDGDFGVC